MEREELVKTVNFAILIILSLLLITLIFATVRVLNDKACGRTDYDYLNDRVKQNGTEINTASGYLLIKFSETVKPEYQLFCYEAIADSASGLKISVINEFEEVLGYDVVKNTTTTNCVMLTTPEEKGQYLGLKCDDCDASNKLILKEEVLGDEVEAITYDGSIDKKTIKSPIYTLKNYTYCYEMFYYVLEWSGFFLIMLLAVHALLYFTQSVEELGEESK